MSKDATLIFQWEEVAKSAYLAYAAVTDNKNFRGEEMPKYEDLPDRIKDAWNAAVRQVGSIYESGVDITSEGKVNFPDEQRWKGYARP